MCGDFNAHAPLWDDLPINRNGKTISDFLNHSEEVLLANARKSTMVRNIRVSSPDLTLVSADINNSATWTLGPNVNSDHFPIILKHRLHSDPAPDADKSQAPWNLTRADWDSFEKNLDSANWVTSNSLEDRTKLFTNNILQAANKYIGKSKPRSSGFKPKSWWDSDCELARLRRDRLLQVWKHRPDAFSRAGYFRGVATLRRVVRRTKRTFFSSMGESLLPSTSSRPFWAAIRRMNGTARTRAIPVLKADVGVLSPQDAGKAFSSFFGSQEKKRPNPGPTGNLPRIDDERVDSLFSETDLQDGIRALKHTAPGPDGILPIFLEHLPQNALSHLLSIFNDSWTQGYVPSTWRSGIIVPIPKPGGNALTVDRYRPITLLSVVGKLLDRLVLSRLNWWMLRNNKWALTHHGGIPGRSVHTAIADLLTAIGEAEDARSCLAVEFLDVKRAYDTLDRNSIMREAIYVGMPSRILNWIKAFLTDRSAVVRVGNHFSTSFQVSLGVPQGSPLSPALYNLGTNDFARVCPATFRSQFIDDIGIGYRAASPNSARNGLQLVNEEVVEWGCSHGLSFGSAKSVIMYFGGTDLDPGIDDIYLDGQVVPRRSSTRYLGLYIDEKLTWNAHIDHLSGALKTRGFLLRILGHFRWGASYRVLRQFYLACVQPILDYCVLFYGAATKGKLRSLDVQVRRLLRLVTGLPLSTFSPSLYVEAGVLPSHLRREQMSVSSATALEASGFSIPGLRNGPQQRHCRSRHVWRTLHFFPSWFSLREHRSWRMQVGQIGPWELPRITPNNDVDYTKGDPGGNNNYKLLAWLESRNQPRAIYVDASVGSDGHVAAGFSIPSLLENRCVELPQGIPITAAEQWAILMAIAWLQAESDVVSEVIIFSDSLGAVASLGTPVKTFFTTPITNILLGVSDLRKRGCNVAFVWIPSHSGFDGNDHIDLLVSRIRPWPYQTISFPIATTRNVLSCSLKTVHRRSWRSLSTPLALLRPSLSIPCKFSWGGRYWEVLLARARVNRLPTGDNRQKWGQSGPFLCPLCNVLDTVTHRLLDCPISGPLRASFRTATGIPLDKLLPLMLGIGARAPLLPLGFYRKVCGILHGS